MKAFVDENVCISCGLCEGVCPDVFSLDTGVAVATEEVAGEFEDAAREACDGCPVQAISIEE
ncbi:ferredoxin [Clostridium sp.]|uniref:ferredoxin n=1 Tax=Clostridium sp. TaxID=1506 RepID=UPI0025C1A6E7|nr:ferredoxin [Clostridium sp.]MDO4925169.1 ferredoxin [Turicibacter sp.]MDU4883206.1 ferredoxin [Clostridium celatum]MBS4957377.1 ferredoxin [Clostridium sp.]MDO5780202.1 ferredoxin [Clostridium sp.]MDU7076936.1 ferredoxin [Clostridium celatum]